MRWIAAEIAEAVDGEVVAGDPSTVIDVVTQDSREIEAAGDVSALPKPAISKPALFVPLLAERDGHDFVGASGAAVSLSSRPATDLVGVNATMVIVQVDDTAAALAALGSAGRARLDGRVVVGITGSVGKTTTKDFLAAILSLDRPTYASHRSFNNEIGVPLTILNAPDDTEALVLEMGARGIGHIARLCSVGRPTVGIVTTVGAAHTSEFGSVEAVAEAKGELIEALPAAGDGGVAVLNASQPLVAAMTSRTSAAVVTFGPGGDVHADGVVLDDELVPTFTLVAPQGRVEVVLGARGTHLVDNALAAAAAALAVGVSLDTVAAGLARPVLSPMRMALVRSALGTRIIDDTYNANPMSVEAALRSLAALPVPARGRRFAVLGQMAELGDIAAAEHARMGRLAAELGIHVIAVDAPDYLAGLDPAPSTDPGADLAGDVPEAMKLLADPPLGEPIGPDDAVLVKGSRVAGLERLVELLSA
ncbi:MAG: UDP-N-acetylmuramoyl-tripeptide--D-alanyl-D-alanine ligase [Acidimicrobiales bacterium]